MKLFRTVRKRHLEFLVKRGLYSLLKLHCKVNPGSAVMAILADQLDSLQTHPPFNCAETRLLDSFTMVTDLLLHIINDNASNHNYNVELYWDYIVKEKNAVKVLRDCMKRHHPNRKYDGKIVHCLTSMILITEKSKKNTLVVKDIVQSGTFKICLQRMNYLRSVDDKDLAVEFQTFLYYLSKYYARDSMDDDETTNNVSIFHLICEYSLKTIEVHFPANDCICFRWACCTLTTLKRLQPGDLLSYNILSTILDGLMSHGHNQTTKLAGKKLLCLYNGGNEEKVDELIRKRKSRTIYLESLLDELQDPAKLSDDNIEKVLLEFIQLSGGIDWYDKYVEKKGDKIDWKRIIMQKKAVKVFNKCLKRFHPKKEYYHKVVQSLENCLIRRRVLVHPCAPLLNQILDTGILQRILKLMETLRSDLKTQSVFQLFLLRLAKNNEVKSIQRMKDAILESTVKTLEYHGRTHAKLYVICIHTLSFLEEIQNECLPKVLDVMYHGLVYFHDHDRAQVVGSRLFKKLIGEDTAKKLMEIACFPDDERSQHDCLELLKDVIGKDGAKKLMGQIQLDQCKGGCA